MAKKKVAKKSVRKSGGKRVSSSNSQSIHKRLDSLEKQQNKILDLQKKILNKESNISKKEDLFLDFEKKELDDDKILEKDEALELDELKKIEELELNIKRKVGESPLKRITYRDITKGMIGAFFGIVGHFAFVEGVHIAEEFTILRSTALLVTSFIIIVLFLYFTGFRTVTDDLLYKFMPIRALVIYFSAMITVVVVLLLYGKIDFSMPFHAIYNTVAAISILAVLGAGTADLIGKNE